MTQRDERRLMLQAARLYYEEDRTQDEIARHLATSRPKVSRLLSQARHEGIVQIRIVDPAQTHATLEERLVSAFGLAEAVVVAGEDDTRAAVRRRLGRVAAGYLEHTLQDGDVIGTGWGRTLHEVVSALEPMRHARITVVPLLGGLGQITPDFQVHEIARAIASAFGGTWHNLYAPAMVDSDEVARSLLRSADFQQIAGLWKQMNVAVVGIGSADFGAEMQVLLVNYLDADTQARLQEQRAAGDICVRFFDVNGQPCPDAVRGVVGIELAQLQQVRRVIGVAGGASKAEAILGALRGRHIHVLVTDEAAARRVLELT
jgi:deoxyribonucleoside regulator